MSRVFISYRRDDSEASSGRLYETIANAMGSGSIYKDVDNIPLGRDFREEIKSAIDDSAGMIVVVGQQWANERNLARLGQSNDFVRLEIEYALAKRIPIVPVLVDGARLPDPSSLPSELEDALYRNGLSLDHSTWKRDAAPLIAMLSDLLRATVDQSRVDRHDVDVLDTAPSEGMFNLGASKIEEIPVGGIPKPATLASGKIWVPVEGEFGRLAVIDPQERRVISTIKVGEAPQQPVLAGELLWVASESSMSLTVIDPMIHEEVDTLTVGLGPQRPTVAAGAIWVPNITDSTVSVVDVISRNVVTTLKVPDGPRSPVVAEGLVWVPTYDSLTVIDPMNRQILDRIRLKGTPSTIVYGGGTVWTTMSPDLVVIIDAGRRQQVGTLRLGSEPLAPLLDQGLAWIANAGSDFVSVVDVNTLQMLTNIETGRTPDTPIIVDRRVLVVNSGSADILALDRESKRISDRAYLGGYPLAPLFAADCLWLSNEQTGSIILVDPGMNCSEA